MAGTATRIPEREALSRTASFAIGDCLLRVRSDDLSFLQHMHHQYGDCAVDAADRPTSPRVCCTLGNLRIGDREWLSLIFEEGGPPDPLGAMVSLMYPPFETAPYVVSDGPLPGWRNISGGTDPSTPAVLGNGAHVLINAMQAGLEAPAEFVADYLVSVTLATQPHLMIVHGASLCVGDSGIIISGHSHSGKTTTALHLAARGHRLLGDELAVLRLASGELIPLARALHLRPGPRTEALATALAPFKEATGAATDAEWTGTIPIGALFPNSWSRPPRLQAFFFLSGFADQPSTVRCHPGLQGDELWCLANDMINSSWGLAAERRALRLVVLGALLARVPCWRLTVGPPDQTADLIESVLEEQ